MDYAQLKELAQDGSNRCHVNESGKLIIWGQNTTALVHSMF